MAKKVEEFDIDLNQQEMMEEITIAPAQEEEKKRVIKAASSTGKELVSCLRDEIISLRFIPKTYCNVSDPKHVLFGGMSGESKRTFVVPRTQSGSLVAVLTEQERVFLEHYMGLEEGTMLPHKRKNNFWEPGNPEGIYSVTVNKTGTRLNLASPEDYIRYKILLANTDTIAASLAVQEDLPKATYQFVCVSETEETKAANDKMNITMKCYMEYGKISEDFNTLKYLVELLEMKPIAPRTKIEFLQSRINSIIQSNSRAFYDAVRDPYRDTKVMIKEAVAAGILTMKGNFIYVRETNQPLCGNDADPTINVAAQFLNLPSNQELLLTIQAKLKQ